MHHIRINGSHLSCSIERICIILVISSSLIVRAGHGSTQAYACLKPGSRLIICFQTCGKAVIIGTYDITLLIQITKRRENIIFITHSICTGSIFLAIACTFQCIQPVQVIIARFYLCHKFAIFIEHISTALIKDRRFNNTVNILRGFKCLLCRHSCIFLIITLHTRTHCLHPLVYSQFLIFRNTTSVHTLFYTYSEIQLMALTFLGSNHNNAISRFISIKSSRRRIFQNRNRFYILRINII
ncbi:unknown [Bacteroides eggerthii CAG:109]|nr:unknown [Bacteroides eggerthii CAG:109]